MRLVGGRCVGPWLGSLGISLIPGVGHRAVVPVPGGRLLSPARPKPRLASRRVRPIDGEDRRALANTNENYLACVRGRVAFPVYEAWWDPEEATLANLDALATAWPELEPNLVQAGLP